MGLHSFYVPPPPYLTIQRRPRQVTDSDAVGQGDPLTGADLHAMRALALALPAVAFFNSALVAGASQRHRHFQVRANRAIRLCSCSC